MKLIQILIISAALASCGNKPYEQAELKTCMNQGVNRCFTENGLDFYNLMADIEERLIKEGALQNTVSLP